MKQLLKKLLTNMPDIGTIEPDEHAQKYPDIDNGVERDLQNMEKDRQMLEQDINKAMHSAYFRDF